MIGGYIFAGKLWEARREAVTKITVLWAALVMLFAIIVPATLADWGPMAKEEYQAANPGTTLSTSEWVNWEMMYLDVFMFLCVVMALVLGFIGLCIGSMLRKPVMPERTILNLQTTKVASESPKSNLFPEISG